jgi:hypothetical protein
VRILRIDPEIVCLVPNGSPVDTTIPISGVVVYDTTACFSNIRQLLHIIIGNTDVTATHTQVSCDYKPRPRNQRNLLSRHNKPKSKVY